MRRLCSLAGRRSTTTYAERFPSLLDPLPGLHLPPALHDESPPPPPRTEVTTLPNGVRIASQDIPVSTPSPPSSLLDFTPLRVQVFSIADHCCGIWSVIEGVVDKKTELGGREGVTRYIVKRSSACGACVVSGGVLCLMLF
jgi:hypothetical protein